LSQVGLQRRSNTEKFHATSLTPLRITNALDTQMHIAHSQMTNCMYPTLMHPWYIHPPHGSTWRLPELNHPPYIPPHTFPSPQSLILHYQTNQSAGHRSPSAQHSTTQHNTSTRDRARYERSLALPFGRVKRPHASHPHQSVHTTRLRTQPPSDKQTHTQTHTHDLTKEALCLHSTNKQPD